MYKLLVTELANQDLDDIISYIAVKLANPSAAGSFLDEVEKCYWYLKSNPEMYERCNDLRLKREGYRRALIKNYILVYKVDNKNSTVYILRFFYGAQEYLNLI